MRLPFALISALILTAIYAIPALVLVAAASQLPSLPLQIAALAVLAPLGYPALFVIVAATISRPHHKAIVAGKFPRDVDHPIYRARRIYGLCWTCVYYNKPLYFIVLSIPILRRITFRGFGYRGQLDFTVYPDTWIRDLPLLDLGEGAYLGNRATLGTNMAMSNGTSFVDRITVGAHATIGHLAVLAPGVAIGANAEIGARATIGIRATIGANANVQPCAGINHAARIGARATIGTSSYVGAAAIVDDGAQLAAAASVANRGTLKANVGPTPAEPGASSRSTIGELAIGVIPIVGNEATRRASVEQSARP